MSFSFGLPFFFFKLCQKQTKKAKNKSPNTKGMDTNSKQYAEQFKVVILGAGGVGKSSITVMFALFIFFWLFV